MAFSRVHHFSSAIADSGDATLLQPSNWNEAHDVSGADVGGIPYCPTATTEVTSANLTFDGTTFSTLRGLFAAGTMTSDGNPLLVTQTRNAAGVTFSAAIKAVITDTASASGSLAMQILGGASGTTNLLSVLKDGTLKVADGAAATPSYAGANANGSGMYFSGNEVRFSANGTNRLNIAGTDIYTASASTQFRTTGNLGTISTGVLGFASNTTVLTAFDTGLSRAAAGEVAFGNGTAGNASGTVSAAAYKVGGAAGADFGPGMPTSITVVKGIITAIS